MNQNDRAITFYYKTMFDTKLSIDLKQYKQHSWISFVFLIASALFLFYLFKDQTDIYTDAYYELSEAQQNALAINDKLPFAIGTAVIFILFKLTELPYEIHRSNRTQLNWKIHFSIMMIIFLVYFTLILWQIYSNNPTYIQTTWGILLFSNFCFSKNNNPTEEEKLLEEAKK